MRVRLRAKVSEKKGGNGQAAKEVPVAAKEAPVEASPVRNDPTTAAKEALLECCEKVYNEEFDIHKKYTEEEAQAIAQLVRGDPTNPALRPFSHDDLQRQMRAVPGRDEVSDGSPRPLPSVATSGMSCDIQT